VEVAANVVAREQERRLAEEAPHALGRTQDSECCIDDASSGRPEARRDLRRTCACLWLPAARCGRQVRGDSNRRLRPSLLRPCALVERTRSKEASNGRAPGEGRRGAPRRSRTRHPPAAQITGASPPSAVAISSRRARPVGVSPSAAAAPSRSGRASAVRLRPDTGHGRQPACTLPSELLRSRDRVRPISTIRFGVTPRKRQSDELGLHFAFELVGSAIVPVSTSSRTLRDARTDPAQLWMRSSQRALRSVPASADRLGCATVRTGRVEACARQVEQSSEGFGRSVDRVVRRVGMAG
jgi:hypothetical protein